MFTTYFRIAIRSIWKNKSFTFINIIGLALGMAIALLSLLYIANELSYDRFHDKKDRIYRLIVKSESSVEGTETSSIMTAGVGPTFLQEVPEVEAMVRISNSRNGFLTVNDKNFIARPVIYVDSSFFNVFTFPLIVGNPGTVLNRPYCVVLTESFAKKTFDKIENAAGKLIRFNDRDNLLVTGIVKDPPMNSHLRFEALISFSSLYQDSELHLGWNGGWNNYTYLLLKEGSDSKKVEEQFISIAEDNINSQLREIGVSWNYFLQSLEKVHLNSNLDSDIETRGSKTNLFLSLIVAFIILLIACVNFINLTTASSLSRMKEVGIRKVSGAYRRQIVFQFLTETLLISSVALIVALLFIEVFNVWLTRATGDVFLLEKFRLFDNSFFKLGGIILLLIISVGIIAGGYPAYLMSRVKPATAVKGRVAFKKSRPVVQNLLVVFQFTIAIVFIVCTLVIANQLNFLLSEDKGFNPSNKIVIALQTETSKNSVEVLKREFLGIPGVEMAGASSEIPGSGYTSNGYFPEGHSEPLMFHALDIDYDYLETMELEIVQGRNFSKDFGQDKEAYIINEALARQLGWDNPIGKTIQRDGKHPVIGVVNDYNFSPLHSHIEPLIITIKPWQGYSYITLKTTQPIANIKNSVEEKWEALIPSEDFSFFTLDSFISEAYNPVKEFMYMILFCSFLAIFIASLGLFGLAAFLTRKRNKEIAVRKVFGAGINRIFILVSSGFLKWVLLANGIAWPIAWFIMDNYFLANFAYNGGIKWWTFLAALLFTVFLSLFVIVFQIIRLGRLNPIDYIRYE